jgi:hypothetical protein
VTQAQRIHDDPPHRLRTFPVREQVSSNPGWSGDRQTRHRDPLVPIKIRTVQANVRPPGLPANRQGEMMDIGWQVAQTVQFRR